MAIRLLLRLGASDLGDCTAIEIEFDGAGSPASPVLDYCLDNMNAFAYSPEGTPHRAGFFRQNVKSGADGTTNCFTKTPLGIVFAELSN